MAPRLCVACAQSRALIKRPKTHRLLCKTCFFAEFEAEVHDTIVRNRLFRRGDRVAIGASGGKDSTVLAHVLRVLNERHDYGIELFLLSVDEGITGYRDDSLACVERTGTRYGLPLRVVSYRDLYGWTMDEIVAEIGRKNNCTFCGVFRRQALDRGARLLRADMLATGHNADDLAETVLMNMLRGDIARLQRCTAIITGGEGDLPRCKPLKEMYEKEIVLYAFHRRLDYFSTECVYSRNAYRGHAREYLKDLEAVRPSVILDILRAGEAMCFTAQASQPQIRRSCDQCGYMTSQTRCKACILLQGLRAGQPRLALSRSRPAPADSALDGSSLPDW